jgi:predicted alpha-1,2-mannosidase
MILLLSCSSVQNQSAKEPVDYVNPYMGNISHLLVPTFPTIHLPHSMLRVYPERRDFTGDVLEGLPIVVTSHRGSSAFNLSPFYGSRKDVKPVVAYSYDNEKLTPYSYSVYLDDEGISVEYGLSHQSAIYELLFEKEEAVRVALNSRRGELTWDGTAFSGFQMIENDTKVYLYLLPEQLPESVSLLEEGNLVNKTSAAGRNACLIMSYPAGSKKLTLRYGISFIDAAQAQKNMERELSGKDLASLRETGRKVWNEALNKIQVSGGLENDKTVFYTSLYRSFERPVSISEDGRYYSAFDGRRHFTFICVDGRADGAFLDAYFSGNYRRQPPYELQSRCSIHTGRSSQGLEQF